MATLEQKVTDLQATNAALVAAAEALTGDVAGKMGEIDQRLSDKEQDVDQRTAMAVSSFVGTFSNSVLITEKGGADQEELSAEINSLFNSGFQVVRVDIPANTTCFLSDVARIPPGCKLQIIGQDKASSKLTINHKTPLSGYEAHFPDNTRYYTRGIRLSEASALTFHNMTVEHDVSGTIVGPYSQGIVNMPAYQDHGRGASVTASDCAFLLGNCLLHLDGMLTGVVHVALRGCTVSAASAHNFITPVQAAEGNLGIIGIGSWAHRGALFSLRMSSVTLDPGVVEATTIWSSNGIEIALDYDVSPEWTIGGY